MRQVPFLLLITLFLIGILSGCSANKNSPLARDETIQRIFTEQEIRDLDKILGFFEYQICDMLNVRSDSIVDCYNAFMTNMASAQHTGVIYVPVPFAAQKDMYASLSPEGFHAIWLSAKAVNQQTGDTSIRMSLNYEGKYMQFLEALKMDVRLFEAYYNAFATEHMMNRVMIDNVLYNYHLYDFRDVRVRLLVALHYLTLNDTYERKNAAYGSHSPTTPPSDASGG